MPRGYLGDFDTTPDSNEATAPAQPAEDSTVQATVASQTVSNGYNGPLANRVIAGQPMAWLIGLALAIFIIGRVRNHPAIPGVKADLAASPYNYVSIGLTSVVFITVFKAIMTAFPAPGLSVIAAGV